jgi:HSP20 family protein
VVFLSSEEPEKKITPKKKEIVPAQKRRANPRALAPYRSQDLWYDFDRMFNDFRNDFETLLTPWWAASSVVPALETRMPVVDIEDRGKDYYISAELPGFKKEDVEIQVTDESVEIKASAGWKYDNSSNFICTERKCDSFFRMIALPEKIKSDEVEAELKDGVLEVILPKKKLKEKKKVLLK